MVRKALQNKQKKEQKFKSRQYNRCNICGRARAYYRKFGLCRLCFRELANKGVIPGLRKSSW